MTFLTFLAIVAAVAIGVFGGGFALALVLDSMSGAHDV